MGMKARLACLAVLLVFGPTGGYSAQNDVLTRARALHRQVPLIDGHNDFPWALRENNTERDLNKLDIRVSQPKIHTDIPRLREGGVGGQFWSVFVPVTMQGQEAVRATLEQIDIVHRMVRKYPDTFELATTAADVERIFKAGRIASLIGMEGGHSIDNSLATLRMFHALGARYMTLTHSSNIAWADSGTNMPKAGGLSRFGEEVVRELGVDTARTASGKQVIFAWFENKKAVLNWYYSDTHMGVMRSFTPGAAGGRAPLSQIADDSGPILAIASLALGEKPQIEGVQLPVSQIAIELYAPLPGGLAAGGRFAPNSVKVPGLVEVPTR